MILSISIELGVTLVSIVSGMTALVQCSIHYSVSTCTIALNKYCCDVADPSPACLRGRINSIEGLLLLGEKNHIQPQTT